MACADCKSALLTLFFIALCFVGIPIHIDKQPTSSVNRKYFISYVKKFNKSYYLDENAESYDVRYNNFKLSMETISVWNQMRTSNSSALYGLTEFADLSHDEFARKYLKRRRNSPLKRMHHRHGHLGSGKSLNLVKRAIPQLPQKIDWRNKGVVTGVKNQLLCGACWAFSTVGVVESMNAIKTGKLENLSVQEAIDCAGNGNMGCNGGDSCNLLEWLVDNNIKIQPESEYPLKLQNDVCHMKKSTSGVQVASNFTCEYLLGEEDSILQLVAFHGPVVVAVNALSWQFYLGGVIEHNCPGDARLLNHAVQIVGYDLTAPIPHYIVRNSWGPKFGSKGYLKIAIGSNTCGIANEVAALDVL